MRITVFLQIMSYIFAVPHGVGYYPQMESHTNSQPKMGVEFYPRRKPIEALVPRLVFSGGCMQPPEGGFRAHVARYPRYLLRQWALFPSRDALEWRI